VKQEIKDELKSIICGDCWETYEGMCQGRPDKDCALTKVIELIDKQGWDQHNG
jgi:hypothetical protein